MHVFTLLFVVKSIISIKGFVCADDDGNMTWQDVLKFMFELANSQSPDLMESALHIFT